eukprot:gene4163-3004_t
MSGHTDRRAPLECWEVFIRLEMANPQIAINTFPTEKKERRINEKVRKEVRRNRSPPLRASHDQIISIGLPFLLLFLLSPLLFLPTVLVSKKAWSSTAASGFSTFKLSP